MKKNLNKICALFLFFALVPCMFASGKKDKELRAVAKKGMQSVPFAYLCENKPKLGKGVQFTFAAYAEYEQVLSDIVQGKAALGVLPIAVATKVFEKDKDSIVALGVCGNGNLYVLSKDASVSSLSHLKGRSVTSCMKDTDVDYVLRYLLKKNDIPLNQDEDGVTIDFSVAPADVTASFVSETVQCAVLPEPYASVAEMKGDGVVRNIDLQKEYASVEQGESFPAFLLVANKKYLEENKSLVHAFVSAYKTATDWTNAKASRAAVLAQKYDLGMMAPVVSHSIPYASFTWVDAKTARPSIETLLKNFSSVSASAGKELPDETFYYVF